MSFDGITFRELVQDVPQRRITEVLSFWRGVFLISWDSSEHEGSGGCQLLHEATCACAGAGLVSALLWANPRAFIQTVRRVPQSKC